MNVVSLLDERRTCLFDRRFVHTLRSNRTLSFEVSKNVSIRLKSKRGPTAIDIDHDGQFLISGDSAGCISIHKISDIEPNCSQDISMVCYKRGSRYKLRINSINWYPYDSGMFVTGSAGKSVEVWDTNEMTPVEKFNFSCHVNHTNLTTRKGKTSHLIAAALSDDEIRLCDIRSGSHSHTLKGHSAPVTNVLWSKRNSYALVSSGKDGKIVTWDIRKSKAAVHYFDRENGKSQIAHSGGVSSLSQTEGGLYFMSHGADHYIRCWDAISGENTMTNFGVTTGTPPFRVTSAISINSCYPGLLYQPIDSTISVYDILSGQHITELNSHFATVQAVCFDDLGLRLYSCSNDGTMLVWEPPAAEAGDKFHSTDPYQDNWSDSD